VALGLVKYELVAAAMIQTQNLTGGLFDKVAFCCHHPNADDPENARCWCRKPSPGLLIESALTLADKSHREGHPEFYPPYMGLMVGDRDEDRECARLAGLEFLPADEWRASGP
jgi:D-glycero-D-manno-heptose 1,7-bisphosphate phosphatase